MYKTFSRGKRKDNNDWVIGYYVHLYDGKGNESHRIYSMYAESDCGEFYPDWFEVDPNTLGEYIGETDTTARRIFEDDIISWGNGRGVINRCGGCFCVKICSSDPTSKNNPAIDIVMNLHPNIKVIGNIYDNFELTEVKVG